MDFFIFNHGGNSNKIHLNKKFEAPVGDFGLAKVIDMPLWSQCMLLQVLMAKLLLPFMLPISSSISNGFKKRERAREWRRRRRRKELFSEEQTEFVHSTVLFIFQVIGYLPTLELYDDTLPSRLLATKKIKLERNRERLDKRRYVRGLKK